MVVTFLILYSYISCPVFQFLLVQNKNCFSLELLILASQTSLMDSQAHYFFKMQSLLYF